MTGTLLRDVVDVAAYELLADRHSRDGARSQVQIVAQLRHDRARTARLL